jgi:hypothetical protein
MLFAMRISLPDRPGMLGSMATALSDGGANIVTLDVIDRDGGFAVDDLCVEAPEGLQAALQKAAEDVPGAVVEAIRPMDAFRDVPSPLELAAEILETGPDDVLATLVDGLPGALWATWAAAIRKDEDAPTVLCGGTTSPSFTNVRTPWLPLHGPRRLEQALWMPPSWRMGRLAYEVAAAPLGSPDEAVILVRRFGPRFRPSEIDQLGLLARMCAARMGAFTHTLEELRPA